MTKKKLGWILIAVCAVAVLVPTGYMLYVRFVEAARNPMFVGTMVYICILALGFLVGISWVFPSRG